MYPANTKLSSLKSRLRIIVFGALLTLLFTSCGAPFGAEQSSSTPSQQCGTLTDQQALEKYGQQIPPYTWDGDTSEGAPWDTSKVPENIPTKNPELNTYDPCAEFSWITMDLKNGTGSSPAHLLFSGLQNKSLLESLCLTGYRPRASRFVMYTPKLMNATLVQRGGLLACILSTRKPGRSPARASCHQ